MIIYSTKIYHLLLCQALEIKAKVVDAIFPAITDWRRNQWGKRTRLIVHHSLNINLGQTRMLEHSGNTTQPRLEKGHQNLQWCWFCNALFPFFTVLKVILSLRKKVKIQNGSFQKPFSKMCNSVPPGSCWQLATDMFCLPDVQHTSEETWYFLKPTAPTVIPLPSFHFSLA